MARTRNAPATASLLSVGLVVALCAGSCATSIAAASSTAKASSLPTLSSPLQPAPSVNGAPPLSGPMKAPGGPFIFDRNGRVVLFHGVNVVEKNPPYEAYPDPGKPWNFNAADASLMARLGFNVVRLGISWRGLEPGTASANDPKICSPGTPTSPNQFNQAVLDRYLKHVAQTVDLLGRYHIYTMLDMHQDVYNQMFDGDGEPNWAVCTNGVASVDPPGRWSLEYGTAAAGFAFDHFWDNDVVGDLQGEYDRIWGDVATYFSNNPWILGYDPFNEPFSTSILVRGGEHFDGQLECFYTGTAHIGAPSTGVPAIRCPRHDPVQGVIPTILANDPKHLIFNEPDNYASRGYPTYLGPMNFSHLVYNVHVYCGARSPLTGNPTDVAACTAQELRSLSRRATDRTEMVSHAQPGGPPWFVSEFGATSSPTLVASFTAQANKLLVGWAYWSWRFFRDPAGSSDEALVMSTGRLRSTARALSETYPEAIAGTPSSISFTPRGGVFHMAYRPNRRVAAPTVIFVPVEIHYPHGYCPKVSGGSVVSQRESALLEIVSARSGGLVHVTVAPGPCRS